MSNTELGKERATALAQVESLRATQVPLGISLVYYSLVLMLLAIIGIFSSPFLLSGNPLLAVRAIFGLGVLIIVAGVLSLVGTGLCLTAPAEMYGQEAISFAVVFNAAAILICVAGHFTTLPRLVVALPNLLAIASFVSFLVFLKHVGGFMRSDTLVSQAAGALNLGVALVVVMVLFVASASVMPMAGALLGLLAFILGLVGFLRYARLLHDLKQAFARA